MGVKATLINKMVEALRAEFGSDEVGVIQAGPLHEDPTKKVKSVMLREMDPIEGASSDWYDRRYSSLPQDQRDFTMADEVGGNDAWYLRFVAELQINYARQRDERETAHIDADSFKDRVIDALGNAALAFAEGRWVVYAVFPKRVTVIEQGGAGQWQWRYALYCQAPAMHLAKE